MGKKIKKFWQWLLYGKPPTDHELHNVRYRGKTLQEFMAQETKETGKERNKKTKRREYIGYDDSY